MEESDMQVFIRGASNYFKSTTKTAAEVETPYLLDGEDDLMMEFSAAIGISGNQKGCVYFTAPKEMAQALILEIGETDQSDELCADMVGEVANTISGNAREELGTNFMISVPLVLEGQARNVRFPKTAPTFIIPITWKDMKSLLIICLEDKN